MKIDALEKVGNPQALTVVYHVGPTHVTAMARWYSTSPRKNTVMIVSHGGQRANNGTNHGAQVRAFAFLVPFSHRLLRQTPVCGVEWANLAAGLFATHETQFRTIGIPSLYLLPHTFDNLNNDYDRHGEAYATALQHWDIIVLGDMSPWPTTPYPALSLYRFLNGMPCLADRYQSFIMHCCRSAQLSSGGRCEHASAAPPSGLFSYDDSTVHRFG